MNTRHGSQSSGASAPKNGSILSRIIALYGGKKGGWEGCHYLKKDRN